MVDPEFADANGGFRANLASLSALTGEDCLSWPGYLAGRRQRRSFFASMDATSVDLPTPKSAATRARGNPLLSAIRTASCLNSSLCLIISSFFLIAC